MQYTLFCDLRLPDHSVTSLLCGGGKILAAAPNLRLSEEAAAARVVRCRCAQAIPLLCDLHAHIGEPGFAYRETLQEGAAAARAGGFGAVCAVSEMPPRIETAKLVQLLRSASADCRVLPTAPAFTKTGECEDFAALRAMGAVAFTDHGGRADAFLLLSAMRALAKTGGLLLLTCRDPVLGQGVLQEGRTAEYLREKGIPAAAETVAVARALALAEETGCRVHLQTVSAAGSFSMIRAAKARGVPVTCEVTPLYGIFTDDAVFLQGSAALLDPPLRTRKDVYALQEALADGTVDAVVSDHTPRAESEKALPLSQAFAGSCGFETAFAAAYTYFVRSGVLSLCRLVELMGESPRRILGLAPAPLPFTVGADADFVLLASEERKVEPAQFRGKARNTPLAGGFLAGMPQAVVCGGIVV